MKHKLKIFDIGRSTYFHHCHGVIFRRKRSRILALHASILLVIGGGFFMTSQLALPAIKHSINSLQNQRSVDSENIVQAEPEPDEKALPEIREEDDLLKELLKEKIAVFPSEENWSVFSYDLAGNETVNISSNRVFAAGSLYKLFLLEALESKLPYDRWAYTWLPDGTNVQDCVYEMLQASDSACGEVLGSYIGWDYVDKLNHKNGFDKTTVSADKGRKTTAANVGELLIRLKKGQALSDNARRFVFDALYQQLSSKGIAAGCNNKCRTADKIAKMNGFSHDVGIVTHGKRSYVFVALSEEGSLKQIAELVNTIESQ